MTRAAGTFRDVGTSLYQVFKEFQLRITFFHSLELCTTRYAYIERKYKFCPHKGFRHSDGPECITHSKFEFQSFKGMTLTTDQKQALNRYFISLSKWFFFDDEYWTNFQKWYFVNKIVLTYFEKKMF